MSKILQLKRNEGVLPNKEAALDALREALKNGKAGEPMVAIFNGDGGGGRKNIVGDSDRE